MVLCTRSDTQWGGRGVMCTIELPSTQYPDMFQYLTAKKIADLINQLKSRMNISFTRHSIPVELGGKKGVIV